MKLVITDPNQQSRPISQSPNSFSRLSPVPVLPKSSFAERPGSSLWREESVDSFHGLDTSRAGKLGREKALLGVVTGETAKHFLVKCQGSWIPIGKGQVKSAKGDAAAVQLSDIKGRKVKVLKTHTFQPEARLIEDWEEEMSFEARLRDSETEPAQAEDEGLKAYQRQVALTTDLCTDIAALTALTHDPRRSEKYIQSRASRLKKNVSSAFAALRSSDPALYAASRPLCSNLMGNLDLVTGGQECQCSGCTGKAQVSLSCGHALCTYCAEDLVYYNPQADVSDCPSCGREMTVSDKRLILLEKYAGLTQSRLF